MRFFLGPLGLLFVHSSFLLADVKAVSDFEMALRPWSSHCTFFQDKNIKIAECSIPDSQNVHFDRGCLLYYDFSAHRAHLSIRITGLEGSGLIPKEQFTKSGNPRVRLDYFNVVRSSNNVSDEDLYKIIPDWITTGCQEAIDTKMIIPRYKWRFSVSDKLTNCLYNETEFPTMDSDKEKMYKLESVYISTSFMQTAEDPRASLSCTRTEAASPPRVAMDCKFSFQEDLGLFWSIYSKEKTLWRRDDVAPDGSYSSASGYGIDTGWDERSRSATIDDFKEKAKAWMKDSCIFNP